jgi:PST family polysaccharide transporter
MSESLSVRAGRALGVNVFNTMLSRVGTFAIGVALARILGPEEFGTFAVAQLALFAVLSFYELGVSLAIVRWPEPPDRITPTVATISTVSSAVVLVLAFVAAPWFSSAMGAPQATDVVRLLSINVLIAGVVATPAALMQREFQAGRRMFIDQVNSWMGAVVSIGFAVVGMGAMSLAVGRLTGAVVGGALFLYFAPFRFGFDGEIARKLLSFGLPLAGSSIVVFGVTYIDQVLVGAVLGPVALGFYVLAFNLSSWPVNVFSQPVRQVSPAAFARLQRNPPALHSAFVSSAGLLTAATLPICLVLTGAAAPIVNVVYGAEWAPAAAALWCLGLLAALRIFFELVYDYFVVVGNTRVVFGVQAVWLIALIPAVYVGARVAGIEGAGAAQVVVAALVVLPLYVSRLQRNGIVWHRLVAGLTLPLVFGMGVVVVAFAAHRLIPLDLVAIAVAAIAVVTALALEARSMWPTVQRLRTVLDTGGA